MPPRKRRRSRPGPDAELATPSSGIRYATIELDLHGLRAAAARSVILDHLYACHLDRLPVARFNHGHGTGALKQLVNELLNTSSLVARSYLDVNPGITVAELRYGDAHRSYNRKSNNSIVPTTEKRKRAISRDAL